jgi:hypothetical protein
MIERATTPIDVMRTLPPSDGGCAFLRGTALYCLALRGFARSCLTRSCLALRGFARRGAPLPGLAWFCAALRGPAWR